MTQQINPLTANDTHRRILSADNGRAFIVTAQYVVVDGQVLMQTIESSRLEMKHGATLAGALMAIVGATHNGGSPTGE